MALADGLQDLFRVRAIGDSRTESSSVESTSPLSTEAILPKLSLRFMVLTKELGARILQEREVRGQTWRIRKTIKK